MQGIAEIGLELERLRRKQKNCLRLELSWWFRFVYFSFFLSQNLIRILRKCLDDGFPKTVRNNFNLKMVGELKLFFLLKREIFEEHVQSSFTDMHMFDVGFHSHALEFCSCTKVWKWYINETKSHFERDKLYGYKRVV